MYRIILLTVIVICLFTGSSSAAVPQLINFQGVLTDSAGAPLDGPFDITFKLYGQASGGADFWTEPHIGVAVSNGTFSVHLGSITPFAGISPPPGDEFWMGVTVETDPEISPRTRWVSVPFAFQAAGADTASYAHQAGQVDTAWFAFTSRQSDTASYAGRSLFSDTANYAGRSLFSDTADYSETSLRADTARHALSIADNTVDSSNIVNNSIISADIKNATIIGADIAQNTITGFHIAPNVVSSVEITNSSIKLIDLNNMGAADGQVIKWSTVASSWIVANVTDGNGVSTGWTDDGTVVRLTTIDDSVGIGTTTPSAKLDVVGDIVVSGKAKFGPGHVNTGLYSFVAGETNAASTQWSTVGGGQFNNANGDVAPTISGGRNNTASGAYSTVGGGFNNISGDFYATVAGGVINRADSVFSTVSGGLANVAADSAAFVGGGANNRARGVFSVVAGGGGLSLSDSNSASGKWSSIVGGHGNLATDTAAFIGGGANNRASGIYSVVVGGGGPVAADSNAASGRWSSVVGGTVNIASGQYSFIGGGFRNIASGIYSTVSGGIYDTASGIRSTVGGGRFNTASGYGSTIGGGTRNVASMGESTVSGGSNNKAIELYSTVGGGAANLAAGYYSTVPGGIYNSAVGNYSFAAGRRAKANHDGSFVWADQDDADFLSSVVNEFNVRASGGTRIYSNSALTAGVTLAAGASTWSAVSDSALKRNIREVDYLEVLEKVAVLPISQWSYEAQDESIEHIGPMAQDFYRLFGLGEDDKHINTLDPSGISLAAIKALIAENEVLKQRLLRLEELVNIMTK